jgi:hypothetical protein
MRIGVDLTGCTAFRSQAYLPFAGMYFNSSNQAKSNLFFASENVDVSALDDSPVDVEFPPPVPDPPPLLLLLLLLLLLPLPTPNPNPEVNIFSNGRLIR